MQHLTLFSHESDSSAIPLSYVEIRTLCHVGGGNRCVLDTLQKLLRSSGLTNRRYGVSYRTLNDTGVVIAGAVNEPFGEQARKSW